MDFITLPLTLGIVFTLVYRIFELFVRRKERMIMLEKLSMSLDCQALDGKLQLPSYSSVSNVRFTSLRIACLMIGLGLGIIVGTILSLSVSANAETYNLSVQDLKSVKEVLLGSSVLLFGGLGLMVSYLIEQRQLKKEKAAK